MFDTLNRTHSGIRNLVLQLAKNAENSTFSSTVTETTTTRTTAVPRKPTEAMDLRESMAATWQKEEEKKAVSPEFQKNLNVTVYSCIKDMISRGALNHQMLIKRTDAAYKDTAHSRRSAAASMRLEIQQTAADTIHVTITDWVGENNSWINVIRASIMQHLKKKGFTCEALSVQMYRPPAERLHFTDPGYDREFDEETDWNPHAKYDFYVRVV